MVPYYWWYRVRNDVVDDDVYTATPYEDTWLKFSTWCSKTFNVVLETQS